MPMPVSQIAAAENLADRTPARVRFPLAPPSALQVLRPTPLGLGAFICGAGGFFPLNLVGEIYLAELLLPLAVALTGGRAMVAVWRIRAFRALFIGGLITLVGYVVSDLVQGTRPDQYLRGWGRMVVLLLDFWALATIALRDRRSIWWFAVGLGLGGVLYLRLAHHYPLAFWKFAYAEPMFLVSSAIAGLSPTPLAVMALALPGYLSIQYDYRSFAFLALIGIAYAIFRRRRAHTARRATSLQKVIIVGALVGAFLFANALLASIGGDYYASRRASSDAGRIAALEVGLVAIARSPILGYGSWPENIELATLYRQQVYEQTRWRADPRAGGAFFTPHSQVLQAWVEGGILGTAFFLVLIYCIARVAPYAFLDRPRDYLSFLLLYYFVSGLWNFFNSPFATPHRIGIALVGALVVMLWVERRARATAPRPAAPSGPRDARAALSGVRSV